MHGASFFLHRVVAFRVVYVEEDRRLGADTNLDSRLHFFAAALPINVLLFSFLSFASALVTIRPTTAKHIATCA